MATTLEYKGIQYNSVKHLAHELGVSPKVVRRCISNVNEHKNLDQTIDERLNNPPINMGIPVEYKGVRYSSIAKLAEKLGVSGMMLNKWIKKEGNVEDNIDRGLAGEFKAQKGSYKGRPKPIEYNGVVYGSRKELAELLMVCSTTLSEWIKSGDNLTETVKEKLKKRIDVEYKGKKYISITKLSEDLGAQVYKVAKWIQAEGNTTDNIDKGLLESRKKPIKVEYNGVVYPSISSLANALGVSKQVVHNWVRLGGDITANIDKGLKRLRREKKVIYNGIEYGTAKELAKKLGVSSSTISKWIHMEGDVTENINKGLAKPAESSGKAVEYNGIKYKSIKELSLFLNVSPGTICKWTRMNGDTTENINKGLAKLCENISCEIEYDGKKYEDVRELASTLNVPVGTVARWLRMNGDATENINRYLNLRAKNK